MSFASPLSRAIVRRVFGLFLLQLCATRAAIGGAAFTNVAGQLRSEVISGNTYLMADTNGDGVADLWLQLDGTVTIGAGDLAL